MDQPLVSVIIPFWNEIETTIAALRSVIVQTYDRLEIILVDDGSTEDTTRLLTSKDPRVWLLRQDNAGPAAARNAGLLRVQGDYVAFLDADDSFSPDKISRQLHAMMEAGCMVSHTSYYVTYPGTNERGILNSGQFSGRVYPAILSNCPIATPTVMLHRSVVDMGFAFPRDRRMAEDVLAWFEVALRHEILGIDEPLSTVAWRAGSAALDRDKQIAGIKNVIAGIEAHPVHRRHTAQLDSLRAVLGALEQADEQHLRTHMLALAGG